MTDVFQLLGGGFLLYFGAEWLVGGSSALALALRVPRLLVGLTVVAYGTSAPEIIVGIQAVLQGHPAIALGNVLGSNIANIGLILGITALLAPTRVDRALRKRELPVMVLSACVVPVLLYDGVIDRMEALLLLAAVVAYSWAMISKARGPKAATEATHDVRAVEEAVDAAGAPTTRNTWKSIGTALMGLLMLIVGGSLFVEGSMFVAKVMGLSEEVIGLTVVAIGTSLPELVTSLVAAGRGHSDIAIGNVVGSNIFNVLLCLSSAALIGPVGAPLSTLTVDLVAFFALTFLAVLFMRTERRIRKAEGAALLATYLSVMVFRVLNS